MDRDELMHHGVKGMKWGVRRYQNKDGSLTLSGKKRFASISKNENKQKKESESAKWLLKANSDNSKILAKEHMEIARDFNDKSYAKSSKEFINKAKMYDKMIKDIDSGKLKAGRDFITNFKHFCDVEKGIVFKKSDSEIKRNRLNAKDNNIYKKTGIKVSRDNQNRVVGLSAKNINRKQIKQINKMQKSIQRKGDY